MPSNSQSPIPYSHPAPLAGVLVKTLTASDGSVSHVGYWNYDAEGWDAEFDPTKHVRRFTEIGPSPPAAGRRNQAWGVPREPLYDPSVLGLIYSIGADGELKDTVEIGSYNSLVYHANLQ